MEPERNKDYNQTSQLGKREPWSFSILSLSPSNYYWSIFSHPLLVHIKSQWAAYATGVAASEMEAVNSMPVLLVIPNLISWSLLCASLITTQVFSHMGKGPFHYTHVVGRLHSTQKSMSAEDDDRVAAPSELASNTGTATMPQGLNAV